MTTDELHDKLKESGTPDHLLQLVRSLDKEHKGDVNAIADHLEALSQQGQRGYPRVTKGTVDKVRKLVPKVEPEAEALHDPNLPEGTDGTDGVKGEEEEGPEDADGTRRRTRRPRGHKG